MGDIWLNPDLPTASLAISRRLRHQISLTHRRSGSTKRNRRGVRASVGRSVGQSAKHTLRRTLSPSTSSVTLRRTASSGLVCQFMPIPAHMCVPWRTRGFLHIGLYSSMSEPDHTVGKPGYSPIFDTCPLTPDSHGPPSCAGRPKPRSAKAADS